MLSSLLPDLERRPSIVVIMRLSDALLCVNSQNPVGDGRLTEVPPTVIDAAITLDGAATRATKARRLSMVPSLKRLFAPLYPTYGLPSRRILTTFIAIIPASRLRISPPWPISRFPQR